MSKTDAETILSLRKDLREHSYRYHVANSAIISDQDYDQMFRRLVELEAQHPEMADPNSPTMRVGSPIPTSLRAVKHSVRMISLQNVNSLDEAMTFFAGHEKHEVTMEMKVDGMSLHLDYEDGRLVRAVTRGDGTEGQDVTENARAIRTVPLVLRRPVTVSVRGEAYWRISALNIYNASQAEGSRIANPRNGASGSMQLKNSKTVSQRRLNFVAYAMTHGIPAQVETQEALLEYLEFLGFQSTMTLPVTKNMAGLPYMTCLANRDELTAAIVFMEDYRKSLDLDTDGLVIKLSSIALQHELGEGTHEPKWGAAFKFPPEVKEAQLLNVVIQVGKTGQITPVAELSPVVLGGVVVRRASLCNQDELNRLGIDLGDFVKVQRSGEVIPKVIGLARPSPTKKDPNTSFQMPKRCPSCATPLERVSGQVHVFCRNPDCGDQVFAKLVYALGEDALDVDGCGEVTVRLLVIKGSVRRLSDLFALKDYPFLKTVAARKLKEGLDAAKKAPLWRKLSALCIDDIGVETAKDIAARYASILEAYDHAAQLRELFTEAAAANLVAYIERSIDELERLGELGFKLVREENEQGPLNGKTFCITGALTTGTRNEISALIEKNGGTVKGKVTKKVDYLVRGEGGGAAKAGGAAKHGTQTISEDELYRMLGLAMPVARRS